MVKRRPPPLTAKPGQLRYQWGNPGDGEPLELVCAWGAGIGKPDANFLLHAFNRDNYRPAFPLGTMEKEPSILKELEARGYDLTTLRFSIQKKEG